MRDETLVFMFFTPPGAFAGAAARLLYYSALSGKGENEEWRGF
jgi:hypothetical protein